MTTRIDSALPPTVDVGAALDARPDGNLVAAATWDDLAAIRRPGITLGLRTRPLPDFLADWLDACPTDSLPEGREAGDIEACSEQMAAAILAADPIHAARRLLADHVMDAIRGYGAATGISTCTAELEVIDSDLCSKFHTDRVGIRLLCTYRGPGTWWLPDQAVRRDRLGPGGSNRDIVRFPAEIRTIPRGIPALLKGDTWSPGDAGLVHRSPPIAGTGQVRLLMRIDAGVVAACC